VGFPTTVCRITDQGTILGWVAAWGNNRCDTPSSTIAIA
jgi:hypothetical protein